MNQGVEVMANGHMGLGPNHKDPDLDPGPSVLARGCLNWKRWSKWKLANGVEGKGKA
jgi:hypothetical protein